MSAPAIPNLQSLIATLQTLLSNRQLRRLVGAGFALAILFFMARLLVETWGNLAATGFHFDFDLPRLAVSLVLLVVARGFAVEAWRRILISLGEYFDFGFGARVWFLSNLTRYIPGNVWQVATMMVMVEQRGVSKTNALLSQVIYTALALALAGLLGLTFLLIRPEILTSLPAQIAAYEAYLRQYAEYAPYIVAGVFLALIVFFALPPVNRLMVAITARLTRRTIVAPTPTFAHGLVPPIFSLAMWLTNGIAFYLFTSSITHVSLAQIPAFVAMNAGAYFIGYISFITPSGLGFRELTLAWMLSGLFPEPFPIALSLVTRLWTTAGELLGVVLVWIIPAHEGKR